MMRLSLEGISFELRAGEILGVAGVAGNGQTELLEMLSGMRAPSTGSFTILGKDIGCRRPPMTPDEMRELGIGHVPEDRHHHGLVLGVRWRGKQHFGFHYSKLCGDGQFFSTSHRHQPLGERLMKI